jgi:NADPH:quinone reductase-like Zn-dependent oxidoreductase
MKAVVYNESVPLGSPDALTDTTLADAAPTGYDLLVEVHSVSVNPVDTKIRGGVLPPPVVPKVLGWDASGVVRAVRDKVTLFKPGDPVMYAGSLSPGVIVVVASELSYQEESEVQVCRRGSKI